MTNEFQLVEKRELREEFIGRMEVLDKVGDLMMLSGLNYATSEQVADYYGVDKTAIRTIISRNKDEFENDGLKNMTGYEVLQEFEGCDILQQPTVAKVTGGLMINGTKFNYASSTLFPKRAILRVGMLLRDSEIAKEIRSRLLDIVHDAEQGKTEIIENIVEEISEEKRLIMERVDAEMSGDYDKVCVVNAKLFALKNKRIAELEAENQAIMTSKLDITESKSVINRILRKIAYDRYHGNFKATYAEFYSSVNYKLHININNRNGKGLSRFSDDEIFEMEKIARSWAVRIGLDLDDLLKLA